MNDFRRSSMKTNLSIYLIVFLFLLISSRGTWASELEEKAALNSVYNAFSAGDLDGALSQVTEFISKYPDSLIKDQAFFWLGESQYKKNHLPEAREAYREIINKYKASTYFSQASAQFANVTFDLGELDQAKPLYEEMLDQVKEPQKLIEIFDKLIEITTRQEDWFQATDFLIQKSKWVTVSTDLEQVNKRVVALIQTKMDKKTLWKLAARYGRNFPADTAYLQLSFLYDQEKDTFHFEKTAKRFLDLFPKNESGESLKQRLKLVTELIKKHKFVVGAIVPSAKQAEEVTEQVINGANLALWEYERATNDNTIGIAFKETTGPGGKISGETETFIKEYSPKAIIGPLFSKDFESVGGLAETYALPFITPTAIRAGITSRSRYLFRNGLTIPAQARELADYAMTRGGMKRVVVFYPKNGYGEELSRGFIEETTRLGGEVIAQEFYPPESSDFSAEIKKIIKVDLSKYGIEGEKIEEKDFKHKVKRDYTPGFDSIFIPGEGLNAGLIPSQLAFFDIKGVALYGSNGWDSAEFLKAGGKYLDGAVFSDGFFIDAPSPVTTQFVARYRKTFQNDPTIFSAQSYDAMNMILQAKKNGATTGAEVRSALLGLNPYDGAAGTIRFSSSGEAEKKPFILQIKNGKLHQIN